MTAMFAGGSSISIVGASTLGLNLHLASSETADAAELVARLGPQGKFETSYSTVAQLASDLNAAKESHHFYPVLFYFRFPEVYCSISQSTLLSLDTATLIKSTLSDEKYGWLKQSEAVEHLWSASTLMSSATKGTTARKRDSCLCSRQRLGAPLADDETDDSAADSAQDKDRCIGFSNYGVGQT